MPPCATISLARTHWGWWRYMNASITFNCGGRARRIDQFLSLRRRQPDRLLAEHMLPRLDRLDRPGDVQVVGQRVVDRVDLGIGQQRFIGIMSLWDAQTRRRGPRPLPAARGDRND